MNIELNLIYTVVIIFFFTILYFYPISNNIFNAFSLVFFAIVLESIFPIVYLLNNNGFNRIPFTHYSVSSHYFYIIYFVFFSVFMYLLLSIFNIGRKVDSKLENKVIMAGNFILSRNNEFKLIAYSFVFSVPSFYWILNIISVHGVEGFMANRIVLLSGGGFYLAIFKLGQVVSAAVFANQLLRKKVFDTKINYTVLSIALLLAIFPALLQGSRSQIFVPIVSYITAYLLITNNGLIYIQRIKKFLIFGFVILVIALNLGSVRQAIMADDLENLSDYNSESVVKKISYNYGSSENILYLYDNKKPSELLYGQSYLAALVGFVPRAFWSEKPLGGGPFMKNQISENSYDLTSGENISSVTTGALAEAYINFGTLGVFFGPVITITAIFIFYQMSLLLHGPLFISCYSLLVFRFFGYVNGEFFGVTSHIIAILFFGFFCYIVLSFKFKYE